MCCEGWTIKKAEHRRIDGFELWCWRRLLRVPWTARTSNQSVLKEISPGCSLEGLMLKLKLQYFGYLMRRTDSFEKTLMLERLRAGGEGDGRGWHGLMASLTQWTWLWVDSSSWWWTGTPGMLRFMRSQRVGHDWVAELNWTECRRHKRCGFDPWVGKIPCSRKWQPTPVFLPGEFHGQRISRAGYGLLGCKEFDMTECMCMHMCTHTHKQVY